MMAALKCACVYFGFDFIECFTTTFLRAHSWLNWVDEDDDEVGLKVGVKCPNRRPPTTGS